jgi:hypothetical protein
MNTPDPFEKRLSEIPMRNIPADWRNEILLPNAGAPVPVAAGFSLRAAGGSLAWVCGFIRRSRKLKLAATAATAATAAPLEGSREECGVFSPLRQCLWPHPAAWGTLTAAWVVIVALNVSSGVTFVSLARREAPVPPSPELLALLSEQRALLRSLLAEPTPPPPPVDRKPSMHWLRRERVSSVV